VKLLVDTHALLWYYLTDPKLSQTAKALIDDPANQKLISVAAYWQIAIKLSLGKIWLAESYPDFIQHAILDNGFLILPIKPRHAAALLTLPHHHKDPFDRIMVAQALIEAVPFVSVDPLLDPYPITRLW